LWKGVAKLANSNNATSGSGKGKVADKATTQNTSKGRSAKANHAVGRRQHAAHLDDPNRERFFNRRLLLSAAIVGVTGLLIYAAPRYPALVENYYSRGLYPYLVLVLNGLSGLLPVSVAEVTLALIVSSSVGYGIVKLIQWYRRRGQPTVRQAGLLGLQYWGRQGLRGLVMVSSLMLGFLVVWGLNYHRQPLVNSLALGLSPSTNAAAKTAALTAACQALIEQINADDQLLYGVAAAGVNAAASVPTAATTVKTENSPKITTAINTLANVTDQATALPINQRTLNEILDEAYRQEPLLQGVCAVVPSVAKPVYFSRLMSYLHISGVYFPFTAEAHYNREQPDVELPFVIAHEKAHQRGIARESEANFVAFLVCQRARHPYVRYAGNLLTLNYLLADLVSSDARQYQQLVAKLLPQPRRDRQAIRDFWRQYQGRISRVATTANDAYLKANNVHSGVANYDEMVELILAYRQQRAE
jgi:hypothetical protein